MCLNGEAAERKITERTKAIIPVHFAGLACKIEDIETLMVKYDIPIIYDAAHAVGGRRNNLPVGKWGQACCYSFGSEQNMTTLGEGGALLTNDADFAERVRRGKFNCRMTKVQAAVGLSQLAKIDRINAERRERFLRLAELLADVEEVNVQEGIDNQHACNLFVVQLQLEKLKCDRDEFRELLQDEYQVGTGLHYPAVWSREAARQFEYDNSDCPHTERICSSVISLPVSPRTSEEELQYVAWSMKQLIAEQRK